MEERLGTIFAKMLTVAFLFLVFFNNENVSAVCGILAKVDEIYLGGVFLEANTPTDDNFICVQGSDSGVDQSLFKPIEYVFEEAKSAGIKNISDTYVLDTKYNEPDKFVIYYGELAYSGISDYSVYDFMVVHDRKYESVQKARSQGCRIFQYQSFGSRFVDSDSFIVDFKIQISDLKNQGLADGIFLDECDVAYWAEEYLSQSDKCKEFYDRLKEITDFCKSIDLKTVVNGSRAFCELGDYYLWESFQGYWNTNSLLWSNAATGRTKASDGAVTYKRPLSEWTVSGSCYFDGNSITNGSNGSAEILVDMDTMIELGDRMQIYDWVYFQWFGSNTADANCSIWVWTGDSMPFDERTWTKLPVLWESKVRSWNGIGKTSKYLKIKMEFSDAKDLQLNSIQLTYNYLYPYWNMAASNGDADLNPYLWNYNNVQRDYLWEKINASGNKIKVLAHTYGREDEEYKKMFSYLSARIWGYNSFDYVHPRMQQIYDTEETDNPIGMLLKREGSNIGYFTGATAEIDTSTHQYSLTRSETDYWYKKAINVDGAADDWSDEDVLYRNNQKVFGLFPHYWSACSETFLEGTFDNVEVVSKDGRLAVLELISDGTGTWTSPVITSGQNDSKSLMEQSTWNSDGEGDVSYYIKYKSEAGEWSDWFDVSEDNATSSRDFVQFQVKVVLSGNASYEEIVVKKDNYGNVVSETDIFHQSPTFWGSEHSWKVYLNDDTNVKKLSVTDDNKYIYLSFEVEGTINFSDSSGVSTDNLYEIYINTTGQDGNGYTGSWWTSSFGADYKISNNSIYKWNVSYPKNDYKGWTWVGIPHVTYRLSSDKKLIEYRIRKDSFGVLEAKSIKMYMYVEDVKTKDIYFVKPLQSESTDIKDFFSYNQKSYKQKTPHGWFRSDEIDISDKTDVGIVWEQNSPTGTAVKAWMRTKQKYLNWSDWQEVTTGEMIRGNYDKVQYCFGLYTNNGEVTPSVKNISYVFGKTTY